MSNTEVIKRGDPKRYDIKVIKRTGFEIHETSRL